MLEIPLQARTTRVADLPNQLYIEVTNHYPG